MTHVRLSFALKMHILMKMSRLCCHRSNFLSTTHLSQSTFLLTRRHLYQLSYQLKHLTDKTAQA